MTEPFFDRLGARIEDVGSPLCVGLDPDPARLPPAVQDADLPRLAFTRRIVEATHEHAAAYKPQVAYFEDADGWRALRETIDCAHDHGVPVVLDAKRGDIGTTAQQYATHLDRADAITVNPYLGEDSLAPFLDRTDAGVFVLCRTSNPGGADLQDLALAEGDRFYERVADLAARWDRHGTVGLVVGATAPAELRSLRNRVPALPFLVPGVGAQGGDVEAAATHAPAAEGAAAGVGLVNSARSIIFAGEDGDGDFFEAAGEAARDLAGSLATA
ncbi:MAG: orotidine-5'-phosphate decarboxylase [Halobacteriaceae archaeon]